MKDCRIVFTEPVEKQLKDWLSGHPRGHERGAIVLFRRISRNIQGLPLSHRFLAVEFIKMEEDWIIDDSPIHLTINMRKFPEIYFRCEQEQLELGFIHNHPNGVENFSKKDDKNEQNILQGIVGCNSVNSFLISLVLINNNRWIGRVRCGISPKTEFSVRHILVLGRNMQIYTNGKQEENLTLKRQEAAFGKPFNAKLQSLRVAVIGLGGTGSPVATLLARSGIGELILIDKDRLEATNMNRVRGYIKDHIDKPKATSLKEFIDSLGLSVKVTAITEPLHESAEAIDAIATADAVFGCTDDAQGRDVLNQALYYYGLVFLDTGIAANIKADTDEPYIRSYKARISCILPEHGACLRCQRVISDDMIRFEEELKRRPELLDIDPETLEREYYLRGGGVQAPGVGPFTSAAADFVVATFMNLVKTYRKLPEDLRDDNIWVDFIHMEIQSVEPNENPECPFCVEKMLLFKREDKYRLDTPSYGEINYEK